MYLVLVCCFFCGASGLPQDSGWFDTDIISHPVVLNEITQDDGLLSLDLNSYIYRDSFDLVWVSSSSGLHSFNGKNVISYPPDFSDSTKIISPWASNSDIFEDQYGDLWFSNDLALIKYNRREDRFKRYNLITSDGDTIRRDYGWLFIDSAIGKAFIEADRKLYQFSLNEPLKAQLIVDQTVGRKSTVGVFLGEGLKLFNFSGTDSFFEVIPLGKGFVSEDEILKIIEPDKAIVNHVEFISEYRCLVSTSLGVRMWDPVSNNWSEYLPNLTNEKLENVTEVKPLSDGQFLVASKRRGLFLLDCNQWQITSVITRLKEGDEVPYRPNVDRIYVDDYDLIWVSEEGVPVRYFSLNKNKMQLFYNGSENNYKRYKSFSKSKDGGIWVAAYKGVLKISSQYEKYYSLPISGDNIQKTTFVHEDERGYVWLGTLEWLFVLRPMSKEFEEVEIRPLVDPNLPGYITCLELKNGDLLFGTNDGGILKLEPGRTKAEWLDLPLKSISAISYRKGKLVTGSAAGVVGLGKYQNGNYIHEKVFDVGSILTSIKWCEKSNIYYASSFSGLFRIYKNSDSVWKVEKIKKVPTNSAISIEVASCDTLWLSGTNGLSCYIPENGRQHFYNPSDGEAGPTYFFDSSISLDDGKMIFGGSNGINVFSSSSMRSKIPESQPAISKIRLDQGKATLRDYSTPATDNALLVNELSLPFDKNDLYFEFFAKEYSEPSENEFKYQLKGAQYEGVRHIGNNNELTLTNLLPGEYTLLLWSTNGDKIWSETPYELKMSISPPWSQTWWAYIIYTLSAIAFGVSLQLFYSRRRRVEEKKELYLFQLESSNAKAQARAAETETSVLRLQMNPHFIFNSLNAVNAFLWKGNKLEANEYLARFALLMRETLNRSTQTLSRLEDTIDSLENYLGTEQMRLGDRMGYKFEVDESLDAFSVYFPTMMLQPFVENAIWHGISGLEGKGLIIIRFKPDRMKGVLIAEVEDNGRGREKAAKRNAGHKSKSLSITQRRLDLLNVALSNAVKTPTAPAPRRPKNTDIMSIASGENQSTRLEAKMEIVDLVRANGSARGTLVRLILPLKYPMAYARDYS